MLGKQITLRLLLQRCTSHVGTVSVVYGRRVVTVRITNQAGPHCTIRRVLISGLAAYLIIIIIKRAFHTALQIPLVHQHRSSTMLHILH